MAVGRDEPCQLTTVLGGTVETILGVLMAPTTVRMVLFEGENADAVAVEENIERTGAGEPATRGGLDQVISAIVGTQEGAAESGYRLLSTGVTVTEPAEAAALRDALADHNLENVTLVTTFLAAAALAQEVGNTTGYRRTALLFVEPHTATLAVVNTADGSIVDVHRRFLSSRHLVAELAAMVSGAHVLPARPDGLLIVGSGIDVAPIKPALEAATLLTVSTPEQPQTALARGAALASTHAGLLTRSTAALAYAKDPRTGAYGPYGAASSDYFDVAAGGGEEAVAVRALPHDQANAYTGVARGEDVPAGVYPDFAAEQRVPERQPLWVVASAAAGIFAIGVVAVVIALVISSRPNVGTQSNPRPNLAPTNPTPASNALPPRAPVSAPTPAAPVPGVTPPPPAAPAPAPVSPAPAALPPVVPRAPVYNPPWPPAQPPGGGRGGGEDHGDGEEGRGGGKHGEGGGHGGGGHGEGGRPGY